MSTILAVSPGGGQFGTSDVLSAVAVLFLLCMSGFFAMAETSLTRMSRIRAGALIEEKRRGSAALRRLVEHPERFLNPLLLLILACHLVIASLMSLLAAELFGSWGVVGGIVLEIGLVFVVAESMPKTWAVQNADRAALLTAPAVAAISGLPPVQLISRGLIRLSNILLPGKGLKHGPATSEQELLAMADAAVDEDVIERREHEMIHSIIEFGDTVVREVMVPRRDMITVQAGVTVADAAKVAIDAGFSRLPVTGESKDDIAGVIYAKDILRALRDGGDDAPVSGLIRPARFCPESKRVSEVMREMQAQKFHLAVVLDEYGGTAGLVTLEDLLEELVGEIVDEYDQEEAEIERLPHGDVRVNARMLIEDLNDLLEVAWPAEDWDTVGGLLFDRLGHVAVEGETVEYEGHLLRAEKVKGRGIGRVRITRIPNRDLESTHAGEAADS